MAKRRYNSKKKSRGMKMQPAITDLEFLVPAAGGLNNARDFYIDVNRELSKINRRLYEQGRLVGISGLTFVWRSQGITATDLHTLQCTVRTAGNTWLVQNAWVKGKALWDEMQQLVLADNPSIAGKWHDFKVTLSGNHVPNQELLVVDGAGVAVMGGEWNMASYVMPQHDVDLTSGEPLAAAEFTACLIGDDTTSRKSLVKAYQESRATPSSPAPNIPAGMSTSFFNLLTDSGSQEPELAVVIEGENDEAPYALDDYPGGATNAPRATTVQTAATSAAEVDGRIGGFVAPCGLIRIDIDGYDQNGNHIAAASMPEVGILLHVAPGSYKGIASIPMGQ